MTFEELLHDDRLKKAVLEMGYTEATKIQEEAIPHILAGKDVLGLSNTGTGKTAAFGLPTLTKIVPNQKKPQALILCPTRELVTQVATELRKFSKYMEGIKIVPIYGGQPIDRQIQLLRSGCGIVVGTPGRIMDHLRRKTLKMDDIATVILDEADEMLNMGFKDDIIEILSTLPSEKEHQTILFSATMPSTILKITNEFQKNPVTVKIKSAQRTIDTVEQVYYDIPKGKKTDALRILLYHYHPELCMIFCNTKKMVDELHTELNKHGLKAASLHGDMKQEFRSRVMNQFRSGAANILIATDVAARGIDVDNIDLVINFDIPQDFEYYIHRIGRTGRAGKSGLAITLLSGHKQRLFMKDLIRYTKTNIPKQELPTAKQLKERSKLEFIKKVHQACDDNVDEDILEVSNELMAEGISLENLVAGLVSMNYKHDVVNLVDEEKIQAYTSNFDSVTIKINIGKRHHVQPGNIVAAIIEECDIPSKAIGHIELKDGFTLVDIDAHQVDQVLQSLQRGHIKGKEVRVEIDQAPKRKTGSYNKDRNEKKKGSKSKTSNKHYDHKDRRKKQ